MHQIPGVKVFVGRRIKRARKSLQKILASRADGDRIQMLKRTLCPVLVEKGVTSVWRLSENLKSLTYEFSNAVDERSRVKRRCVWLRQVNDLMWHSVDREVPALELADDNW